MCRTGLRYVPQVPSGRDREKSTSLPVKNSAKTIPTTTAALTRLVTVAAAITDRIERMRCVVRTSRALCLHLSHGRRKLEWKLALGAGHSSDDVKQRVITHTEVANQCADTLPDLG